MEDKKLLILVVDDSVVQLHHAVQICLETGAEVVSARDGQEALEILRREPVDVALIDLEMPVMDGVELISQIATEKLTENIVILSSKDASLISSVGSMAEADGLTVLASVSKPITNTLIEEFLVKFGAKINDKSLSEIESGDDFYVSYDELLSGINGQQFLLHYQPKLTCKGLLLKGVEALARWEHPERGFIPPTIFIAAAEKYQLIGPLTMMIFEQALTQKKRWQDKGLNFNLALNLSPQSLVSTEFANSLDEFVRNHDVKPSDVTLEVTENILLGDVARSLQILSRLRLKGFHISIDDYGTGFSNAEQLSRIPATELKIDRSLVTGVADKPRLSAIIDSTIKLANELNLTTVAEGVETEADLSALMALGVDVVQGYYLAKPFSPDLLNEWIKTDLKKLRG